MKRALILCGVALGLASCGDYDSRSSQYSTSADPDPANYAETESHGAMGRHDAQIGLVALVSSEAAPTEIVLSDDSIAITGSGATVDGNRVTISSAGQFAVTGTISDGQIIVETSDDGDVEIGLEDANITCSDSAPINIRNGDVVITLAGVNTVTDGDSYVYDDADDEEPNGTIFSKDDITITGTGSLEINANFNDGINCNDDLIIAGGTLDVTAVDDGLVGNDSLEVKGGVISISASSQGLKSDVVSVSGGEVSVLTCTEGIEAELLEVSGGVLKIYASDDALNATMGERTEIDDGSQIVVSGGELYLSASAGDAIDSNGSFSMTGGTIGACGPTSGPNVAIDVNATTDVSGGLLIATSSNSDMNEYPNSDSSQYSMAVMLGSVQAADSIVCVEDSSGNDLIRFRAERDFYTVIFSSPDLQLGSTYSLSTGGTVSGGSEENGIITGGTYSGGTVQSIITLDTFPTTVVGGSGGGSPGSGGSRF